MTTSKICCAFVFLLVLSSSSGKFLAINFLWVHGTSYIQCEFCPRRAVCLHAGQRQSGMRQQRRLYHVGQLWVRCWIRWNKLWNYDKWEKYYCINVMIMLLAIGPGCYQRETTCDTGLMVAACRALNMTLPSGGSLPQSCSAALVL